MVEVAGKRLTREALDAIVPYEPGRPIELIERDLGLKRVLKLASNENPLGPSPKALAALRSAARDAHRYPDGGSTFLKEKLAAHCGVSVDRLVLGNGSDEIIVLALRALVEPGEEVVVADPTFLIYKLAATAVGAKVVTVPLKGMRYDLAAMRRAVTPSTKMIFIANPDNPTGTYVTREEVDDFLSGLPEDVVVFFDEAYYEFARDLRDYPRTLSLLDRRPVIISRSFSKAYGLAGARVGYGIASAELVSYLERVREPFNVNRLAQAAACAALGDQAFLKRTLALTEEGRDTLSRELSRLGLGVVPSAANFVLFDCLSPARGVFEALLARGIIVREMSAWGLPRFIRVTVGRPQDNRAFLRALKAVLHPPKQKARSRKS